MGTGCGACGADNREGRRFCAQCGAPLGAPLCPACGAANEPGERLCGDCGAALVAAVPREPEGERKQLTVLFADVAGSMELAEGLDPEEWAAVMDRFVQVVGEGVQRFGGTVDKFTGDGVMALFGAPAALEDHARRDCHAALHLGLPRAWAVLSLRRAQLPRRVLA